MSPRPLAELLRAAREAAGLSRAALADRMGVSWETVRQAESGRDPRHSTLLLYLKALPFASPRTMLLGEEVAPPLASEAAWQFYRGVFGFGARRMTVSARADAELGGWRHQLDVEGIRPASGDLRDAATRSNLMRSVFVGSGAALRHLQSTAADATRGRQVVEAEGVVHEFHLPRSLARAGMRYTRTSPRDASAREPALQGEDSIAARTASTLAVDVVYPVEELVLHLALPAEEAPVAVRLFAAPDMAVPPRGAFALASAVVPAGALVSWDARSRTLVVTLPHPLPHLRHGIAWVRAEGDSPAGFVRLPGTAERSRVTLGGAGGRPRATARTTLGHTIASARERAGLSRRQLAARMGVSPATVICAEVDRDPRASTLSRCLEALPELTAESLLQHEGSAEALAPADAWLYYRNLVGIVAAEATRIVKLAENGDATEVIGMRSLRRLHAGSGDLMIKDAIARGVHGKVGPVFLEHSGTRPKGDLRIRWMRLPGDTPELLLSVPEQLAESGVSFRRREQKEGAYKMRPDQTDRSVGPAYECLVPVERLVLTVRFPKGYWPKEVNAFARAAVNVTNRWWPDLSARLHPIGFALERRRARGEVSLAVERPLLGVRYSITWQAP